MCVCVRVPCWSIQYQEMMRPMSFTLLFGYCSLASLFEMAFKEGSKRDDISAVKRYRRTAEAPGCCCMLMSGLLALAYLVPEASSFHLFATLSLCQEVQPTGAAWNLSCKRHRKDDTNTLSIYASAYNIMNIYIYILTIHIYIYTYTYLSLVYTVYR